MDFRLPRPFTALPLKLSSISLPAILAMGLVGAQPGQAQEQAVANVAEATVDVPDAAVDVPDAAVDVPDAAVDEVSFSFDRTPWRDVIRWLAESSDLALQYEELPTGSFTYSDSRVFTRREAIDRVNLFLLPQGYTLVQTGRLLSLIDLGAPRSQMQLDTLAQLVTVDELDQREDQEVVKCMIPLGQLKPEDAVEELSVLNLMKSPSILSKTNQLLITDTVAKLKSVRAVIQAFEPRTLQNGTAMKSFALKHVTAEDILSVARPHLGLATDEMIGIDVSLSSDLKGEYIFVTGVEDKIQLIEDLVQSLDTPVESLTAAGSQAELKSHLIRGGNLDTVYNVLQTLLAGKSLRLSIDEEASSIVALANPDVQAEIALTVAQLEASEATFEVIPLVNVEPVFAISLLEEMLEDDDSQSIPPKIDADPGNKRLFVRGKQHQIDQIKRIVEGLDAGGQTSQENVRVLPLTGRSAVGVLETAAKFWSRGNAILLLQASAEAADRATERVVAPRGTPAETPAQLVAMSSNTSSAERFLTDNFDPAAEVIRCQFTERGLLVQSDDAVALDEFEEHLRAITGPGESASSPPIVFYLKYTKAAEAITMLAELLDGGEAAREGEAGTLVNGFVSSYSSFLGSFVTATDGTITMSSGSITVVADPRLNRLIAQGTAGEIGTIEDYLAIIDKDESLTSIEVYGTSHVIELEHTTATEVAAVIREAYAGRITQASGGKGSQAGAQPQQAADSKKSEKAPQRSSPSASAATLEPKMTVTVHEPSNSLIVTAPEQLFQDVKQLVALIDTRSEQTMEVVSGGNGALGAVLSWGASSGQRGSDRSRSSSSRPSLSDILRSRSSK